MNKIDILNNDDYKFLPYNTGMPHLDMPEYGRNIQNMVDYCVEIPDREERTACAHAIVGIMRRLFPNQVGDKGDLKKFWDHLNIMSRFRLDIDFPCDVVTAETAHPIPEAVPYSQGRIKFRHYGKNLEQMIKVVAAMEDGEEKDELIYLVAHQMKKQLIAHNPEGVDNARVLRDLYDYSDGAINLDPQTYILHEFHDVTPVATKAKKGRKRKK